MLGGFCRWHACFIVLSGPSGSSKTVHLSIPCAIARLLPSTRASDCQRATGAEFNSAACLCNATQPYLYCNALAATESAVAIETVLRNNNITVDPCECTHDVAFREVAVFWRGVGSGHPRATNTCVYLAWPSTSLFAVQPPSSRRSGRGAPTPPPMQQGRRWIPKTCRVRAEGGLLEGKTCFLCCSEVELSWCTVALRDG